MEVNLFLRDALAVKNFINKNVILVVFSTACQMSIGWVKVHQTNVCLLRISHEKQEARILYQNSHQELIQGVKVLLKWTKI